MAHEDMRRSKADTLSVKRRVRLRPVTDESKVKSRRLWGLPQAGQVLFFDSHLPVEPERLMCWDGVRASGALYT